MDMMISLHTGQSVPKETLIARGAIITRIGGSDLYRVEFPAKGEVGPIGGTWRMETEGGNNEQSKAENTR